MNTLLVGFGLVHGHYVSFFYHGNTMDTRLDKIGMVLFRLKSSGTSRYNQATYITLASCDLGSLCFVEILKFSINFVRV